MERKLLYTYEEWLKRKHSSTRISQLTQDIANELKEGLERISRGCSPNATKEDRAKLKEWESQEAEREKSRMDKEYTELTHQITDMCLNPQNAEIDFELIGKLQFRLERLKYPIVKPY